MPAMSNITVKNVANADVVYSAATPSAGDRSPAIWRSNSVSDVLQFRPSFSCTVRDNQKQTGRSMDCRFSFPVTYVDGEGQTRLLAKIPFQLTGVIPTNIDVDHATEAFTQLGNLLSSSLIRSVATEGYAPT